MSNKWRLTLAIFLCLVILFSLGLTAWAIQTRSQQMALNPNVTLVTAPEQTDFEEHPDWTIPVTEPIDYGENLALGKKVKQSGQTDIYNGRNVTDGDRYTYWEGETNDYPNDVTIDLEQMTQIGSVRILLNPSRIWSARSQEVEAQVSEDGENYVTAYPKTMLSFDPGEDNSAYLVFHQAVQGRYIRILFHSNTGAKGGQAAEIEVYAP